MMAPLHTEVPEGHPMRILHLEDSVTDHKLTCNALKHFGLVAHIVRVDTLHGYERLIADNPFDLVLADYHLPGFTAIEAWHATPGNFQGPFILFSGAIGESAAVAAIQLGVADYLHKDEIFKLGRVIQRAVDMRRIAREKLGTELELRESKQRLAQFADHLQEKMELERAAIAREIHDDIGGSLAAIQLDLAWVSRHCDDPAIEHHIEAATTMLQHALGASQRIMRDLRPAILDQGLIPASRWLIESFERRTGIKAAITSSQSVQEHPKDVQLAAYRTVQEALTNISKYAKCDLIKVDISDFDGVLTVEISDNGGGFLAHQRSTSGGFGLRGLEERARSVGGWLDISSEPGRGTAIILSVPLARQNSSKLSE
jgi:signal transduction histidine kinase